MGADELLTREQAAEYLGVGVRQLHRYQDSGRLPYCRNTSGHIRFTRRQLDAFLRVRERFIPIDLAS